jgi:2-succinyl-5-enolpyruvyl-6-hydroxy-3-cyclohexene-1-carboxylate synthase
MQLPMNNSKYTSEKAIQILVALLKQHGIRKVIACPGGTNMMLNACLMYDGNFEMYSCDDERSASYMATGMSAESDEPVVITCTGATASRNFMPGLTEAFYRKLPILVITGQQDYRRQGNLHDQIIDRSVLPNDIAVNSVYVPIVRDVQDEANAALRINQAISALTLNGGGPSHINLETSYSQLWNVSELPAVKTIRRVDADGEFPLLPKGKIALFIGSHKTFSEEDIEAIDTFCYNHNAVAFCDHTSNYKGRFRQLSAMLSLRHAKCLDGIDLLIHFGEISGDHFAVGNCAADVWRISNDGQLRDTYGKLTYLFNMKELQFFTHYKDENINPGKSFLKECQEEYKYMYENLPDLPFSNIWCAKQLHSTIPENSCMHFGILTSLRSWNFFEVPRSVNTMSNVGGFGTDGMMSSLIGASLVHPNKLYFGVVGDLAFFYDLNSLGNRHIGKNVRIMLFNNGKGCEFKHHMSPGHIFKDDADLYISAAGHFGNQSPTLVRNYATSLGFRYLTASTKDEFLANMDEFLTPELSQSYIYEVFTQDVDENEALKLIRVNGIKDSIKVAMKESGLDILAYNVKDIMKKVIK